MKYVVVIAAGLALAAVACGGSSANRAVPAISSTTSSVASSVASSTTTSSAPTTTTTLGVVPPATVAGLRIATTTAPAGVALRATWLRVERPDGLTQFVAVMRPPGGGRHPVVVYLHGSSGLNVPELAWARRLSNAGFIVVAGCYLGVDPNVASPSPSFWIPCPGLPDSEQADAATMTRAYDALLTTAAALPDARPGALGVVGVSYGGILALSTPEPAVKAIVADSGYGKAGAPPVTAPVLLLGMDSDPNVAHANVTAFEQLLRAAQKTVESHYYAGSGHVATLTFGVPGVAGDATKRAIVFLRTYLG